METGTLAGVGSLAVLALDVRLVIPTYRGEPYAHLWRYRWLGDSLGGIVATGLLHPLRTLAALLTADRLVYRVAMLAPLALLPLLGGWALIGAPPAVIQNLLSADPVLYNFRAQYQRSCCRSSWWPRWPATPVSSAGVPATGRWRCW